MGALYFMDLVIHNQQSQYLAKCYSICCQDVPLTNEGA